MRRAAGRTFELQIQVVFAVLLSLLAGWIWSPWGYLAGVALLAVLIGGGAILEALMNRRIDRCRRRLFELADGRASPPSDWRSLVDGARAPREEAPRILAVADDASHPMREAFVLWVCRLGLFGDAASHGVLAAFVRDHPDRDTSRDAAEFVVQFGPPEPAESAGRAALASPNAGVAAAAAHHLVYRALPGKPGRDPFLALVREQAARIEPLLSETTRSYFAKVLGESGT